MKLGSTTRKMFHVSINWRILLFSLRDRIGKSLCRAWTIVNILECPTGRVKESLTQHWKTSSVLRVNLKSTSRLKRLNRINIRRQLTLLNILCATAEINLRESITIWERMWAIWQDWILLWHLNIHQLHWDKKAKVENKKPMMSWKKFLRMKNSEVERGEI